MGLHSTDSLTKLFTDQLGREVSIPFPPKRIISLVPSQTELLFDLGLNEEIAGITKFCIHPEEKIKLKQKVGGTKNLNFEKIRALEPDLIIANKEENEEKQVKELMNNYPVWISDINTLADAYDMIKIIGRVTDNKDKALVMVKSIRDKIGNIKHNKAAFRRSAAYLIWESPYMTVGGDTFINAMLKVAGFENIFRNHLRYPQITIKQVKDLSPEFILLSNEPFPFNEKHQRQLKQEFPASKVLLVDGQMFSWYGSRLLKAPLYFQQLQMIMNQ
jgi:ABC-type Fe3+-hydroxamate transport system substrate-binding protein